VTATENKTTNNKLFTRTICYQEKQIVKVLILIELTIPYSCNSPKTIKNVSEPGE